MNAPTSLPHRRFQFGLRSLFLLLALFAVLTWQYVQHNRSVAYRRAAFQSLQATVRGPMTWQYKWYFGGKNRPRFIHRWLYSWLGPEHFGSVVQIDLSANGFVDVDRLAPDLEKLSGLETLEISRFDDEGARPLQERFPTMEIRYR